MFLYPFSHNEKCKKHLYYKIGLLNGVLFTCRAHADAGPSVQHSEQPDGEAADFAKDADSGAETERSLEASSGDEEAKDEGGEGKKKKPRSGFRDRKVIDAHAAQVRLLILLWNGSLNWPPNQCPICKRQ